MQELAAEMPNKKIMDSGTNVFFVGLAALAIAGLVWVVIFLIRAYARSILGSQVTISPHEVRKGGEIKIDIEICPRKPLELEMIEITVSCERTYQERYEAGYGRRRGVSSSKDIVCKETTYIPIQGQVGAGERRSYSSIITVPREGLSTDRSKLGWGESQNIRIEWYVTVRFGIVRFPDAIHRQNIFVKPS